MTDKKFKAKLEKHLLGILQDLINKGRIRIIEEKLITYKKTNLKLDIVPAMVRPIKKSQ